MNKLIIFLAVTMADPADEVNTFFIHENFRPERLTELLKIFREDRFTVPAGMGDDLYTEIVETTLPVVLPLNGNAALLGTFRVMCENDKPNGQETYDTIEEYLAKSNRYQVAAWSTSPVYQISRVLLLIAMHELETRESPVMDNLLKYLTPVILRYATFPHFCFGFKRKTAYDREEAKSYRKYCVEFMEEYQHMTVHELTN